IAESSADSGWILEAEHDCGATSHYLGEYDTALRHLKHVEELYEPALHHRHAWLYGKDPFAIALVHPAMALTLTGRVATGLAVAQRAVGHAVRWPHPFSHLWTLIGV